MGWSDMSSGWGCGAVILGTANRASLAFLRQFLLNHLEFNAQNFSSSPMARQGSEQAILSHLSE